MRYNNIYKKIKASLIYFYNIIASICPTYICIYVKNSTHTHKHKHKHKHTQIHTQTNTHTHTHTKYPGRSSGVPFSDDLIYSYRTPPLKWYGCSYPFTVYHACRCMRGGWGGLVGIQNNLLNKEWVEMCGEAYTSSAVTDKPKIHGVAVSVEAPPTGDRGDWRRGTREYPYVD